MILALSIALAFASLIAVIATICAAALLINERHMYDECDRLRDSVQEMSISYAKLERSFEAYRDTVNGFVDVPRHTNWKERM
jgi:hypothetical protein